MVTQQVVQVVVPRAFHQHLVARLEQSADQQVEAMTGTLGGENLLRADLNTDLPQALVQLTAQAGQPQGRTIIEQIFKRPAADLAHRLGNRLTGAPTGRQPAAAQIEQLRRVVAELLPAIAEGFIGQWQVAQRFAEPLLGDKKTGAMARLQHTLGHQAIIGLDHTGLTDTLLARQLPDREQAAAWAQALVVNPGLQLIGDLLHQRRGRLAVECQLHGQSVR
ncbi:hypothetical protein D3C78_625600 [compost metagenome]